MSNLDWADEGSILHNLLLAELDEESRQLFWQVHELPHGCVLLRFLDDHARTFMTIEDIAFHLREPSEQVKNVLRGLIDLGLVEQTDAGGISVFGLVSEPSQRQVVDGLFAWQRRWLDRLSHIAQAIGGTGTRAKQGSIED